MYRIIGAYSNLFNFGGSEAADKSDDGGYVLNITPWSSEVLESAAALRREIEERRRELVAATPGKLGKRGPSGKMDYRGTYTHRQRYHGGA